MSMNTHVVGVRVPSEEYKLKVAAWHACVAAGVPVPPELLEYFEGTGPNENGMIVPLDTHECCEKWKADMQDGFTIDLEKLPSDLRYIRFFNSY